MFMYYVTTKTKMNIEIRTLTEFFTNYLSISLITPLWNYDLDATENIINATMNEKQIYAIIIKKQDGKVILGKIRNNQWNIVNVTMNFSQTPSQNNCVMMNKIIVKNNELLGDIEIWMTLKFVYERLRNALMEMLIRLALFDTLLFLLIFFSIRKMIIAPIRVVVEYLSRLSMGDIPTQITKRYKGEFNEILTCLTILIEATNQTTQVVEAVADGNLEVDVKERSEYDRMMKGLNQMIQRLNGIMTETNGMIHSVQQGNLDIRGNAEAFEGGWRKLLTGVNNLIDGLSSAVSVKAVLETEMELAKHIQTVLLPKKPKIPGYEIVASLQSADEVGGDYFDVISVDGYDWIVIGDVSGHGVTAGLVMMMVQTAIHTILLENPSVPPSHLLSQINKTIYSNIERMNEPKHMTLIALASLHDGVFSFAGLHEDILIWRAADKIIQQIETNGMWIGIEPDISTLLFTERLKLYPGDCMVLYTDGILEARRKDGKLFGKERLAKIIERSGEKSAYEIHADILKALSYYQTLDDVTIYVMKRV
ncbi:MAG: SpoIIE family protein phosphatase [Desulfobacterales bacterium]|nr:SpoIIE family protein phosphatase [Desulfobacterales bacterium]